MGDHDDCDRFVDIDVMGAAVPPDVSRWLSMVAGPTYA